MAWDWTKQNPEQLGLGELRLECTCVFWHM